MRLLITSYAGDPAHPRTWSGTPYRLLQALSADFKLALKSHAARPEGRTLATLIKLDNLTGSRHQFIPGHATRWWMGQATSRAARRHGADAVLHLGSYDLGPGGPPRFLFIDNTFDLWSQHASAGGGLSARKRRLLRTLEARALHRAEHVFPIGEHVRANLIAQYGLPSAKITAVGTGCGDIEPYFGPKDYSTGHLLIVAKVRPRDKGLFLLLEAFELVLQKKPNLRLVVIGGERYPEISQRKGVIGTGWISADQLQAYFNQASLFVMPALHEPWGLAYLEALACRTPIVGLRSFALPELSGHGAFGFMAERPDPSVLAQTILSALSDPQRLARMGAAGQSHCLTQYSWTRTAEQIRHVMQDTLNHNLPAPH